MKKKHVMKVLPAAIIAVLLLGLGLLPYWRTSVAAQPGEAGDPLVTRRYVDERIDTLWNEIQALRTENAQLLALIEAGGITGVPGPDQWDLQAVTNAVFPQVMLSFEALYGQMLRDAADVAGFISDFISGIEERSLGFAALNPQNGQTLIMENGTEVILRTGSAVVVAGPNGLVDMTAGADIGNGREVSRNHLLIAPQSDGRGLRFTANSSWVMVRGGYTLE